MSKRKTKVIKKHSPFKNLRVMKNFSNSMREVMTTAWSFVRRNGYSMSEALKVAWRNYKLRNEMTKRIVKFRFEKVSGEIRLAYGTLVSSMLPPTKGEHKENPNTQVYFDCEKNGYRCFRKANLLSIG